MNTRRNRRRGWLAVRRGRKLPELGQDIGLQAQAAPVLASGSLGLPPTGVDPAPAGAVAEGGPAPIVLPLPQPGAQPQKVAELAFAMDRNQLFLVWNAVANAAELAGTVSVKECTESERGVGRGELQTGMIEPFKEADLIEQRSCLTLRRHLALPPQFIAARRYGSFP